MLLMATAQRRQNGGDCRQKSASYFEVGFDRGLFVVAAVMVVSLDFERPFE